METICPDCHRKNDSASRFCKYCGTMLLRHKEGDELICPKCQTANRANSRFCKHCGSKLEQEPVQDPFLVQKAEFDSTIRDSIDSLTGSMNLPFASFMHKATSLSEEIISIAKRHKETALSSPQSSFNAQFIHYLDQIVEQCREAFWKLCDERAANEAFGNKFIFHSQREIRLPLCFLCLLAKCTNF